MVTTGLSCIATTSNPPAGHSLVVYNGTGDGEYMAGEEVDISANVPEGFVFLRWMVIEGGGHVHQFTSDTKFTMPSRSVKLAAVFGKIESWFPPGRKEGNKGLLFAKDPNAATQYRMEQRIRVSLNVGEASGDLNPGEVWNHVNITADWFSGPDAIYAWHSSKLVKYFDLKKNGTEIAKEGLVPKSQFEEPSSGVYEGSIWYEGAWTEDEAAKKVDSENNQIRPEVSTAMKLDILGKGFVTTRTASTGSLVPVDLAVDANRDGVIKFAGNHNDGALAGKPADKTTEAKPYRFWLNDDNDSGEQDHPGVGPQDSASDSIVSLRDLEDFTRLHLNIGGMQDAIANGTITVGLEWRDMTGSPSIKVFQAAEVDGGDQYLKTAVDAGNQQLGSFGKALGTVSKGGAFKLPVSFWKANNAIGIPTFDTDNPNRYLIFEGCTEGQGQLVLTFWKGTAPLGETGSVWLDIKNIKKMYERFKASPEGIPTPYTNSSGQFNNSSTPQNNGMGQPFDKPSEETKDCLVFVHGWNTDLNDSINTAETMFKRLWWQGFKGHFVAFRWETLTQTGSAPAGEYNRSDSRAFIYGAALKQVATTLSEQYTVSVLAHSMGNIVTGEALQEGMQIRNYIMMQAAVPASCYDPNAATLARLVDKDAQVPTPDMHDPTLGYRGYLQSISGTITRYYNPLDYALATGFYGPFETNWESNQLGYKPDGAYQAQSWYYGYSASNPLQQRGWLWNINFSIIPSISGVVPPQSLGAEHYRLVSDSFEMKAFIARSRTKAVGAIDSVGSPIGASVNMQDRYGFRNSRPDHSGQFTRRIQQVFTLYKDLYDRSKK